VKPRVLIINDTVIAGVAQVRAHALLHRETLSGLMRRMNQLDRAIGRDPNFVVHIFDGWRLVYSLEQQPEPLGWCEHLSVSVTPKDGDGFEPALQIVRRILFPLFQLDEKNLIKGWIEETLTADKQRIGNALFKYTGPLP
jgi:hypothetical protein